MVGTRSGKVRPNSEVGGILFEARTRQKIPIYLASRDLNISELQLHALEEGDFSVFPAEVYARGAYMRYAAYLGVDSKQAERSILRALSGARETVPLHLHTPRSWWDRLLTPSLIISMTISLVAVSIGGYIAWQVESFLQLPQLEVSESVGGVMSEKAITVKGQAESQARINVNGENVLLREDNTFELAVNLRPGVNIIRVEAENAAGRTRVVERHVLLPGVDDDRLAGQNNSGLQ